jgi:hypothetical protein
MTERLQQALAELEKLPESAQDEAAARIEAIASELADRRWDELLADPHSELFFEQMAEQYEQAKRANDFRPTPHAGEA